VLKLVPLARVFVTDGQPSCAAGHEDDYQYWDDTATLAEAAALNAIS
jgi:hypothetical protein